ncbi:ranBP-type and C3HC4-type zinc finger-containing protein 1-like [Ochlerotatus camptorhynchus]|uniref:ranBP-type and C3HC4-type zinc finger-containing protein 1-like n=1 Tax=Ochlerotatus camptorhynchus TaxID=644619 RepID=UPI0031E46151
MFFFFSGCEFDVAIKNCVFLSFSSTYDIIFKNCYSMASLTAKTKSKHGLILSSSSNSSAGTQYQQLLELEKQALVHNSESCLCHLCSKMTSAGMGVVLVNCLHTFCTVCLKAFLLEANTARCPFPNGRYECEGNLEERELDALLSQQEYRDLMERQFATIKDDSLKKQVLNTASAAGPKELDLLMTLTDASVVPNPEPFECPICFVPYEAYEGVILRDCFHTFCRECLSSSIKHAEDVVVQCPYKDNNNSCETIIQDREIKCLLTVEDYNAHLGRSLKKAESLAENAFHCKTPDCTGWCMVEDNVSLFSCPVCYAQNCLRCKALHADMSCEDYQDRLSGNYETRRSERAMENMLASGEAMRCPKCNVLLAKITGCDFIICSMCKTAVCWVTRGPRWGPLGQGDNSGGCRCNVNGKKCHPNCRNCH